MNKNTVKKLERMAREFNAMYRDFSDDGPGLVTLNSDIDGTPKVHIESLEKLNKLFPGAEFTEEIKKGSGYEYVQYFILSNGVKFFARRD